MKSVLISIKPKYCELIANGSKTIEVRKTRPKIETPFKCYIYCTHSGVTAKERDRNIYTDFSGKVIGEFACGGITKLHNIATDKWDYLSGDAHENEKKLCTLGARFTESEVHSYACGKFLYAWHISNLVIYDKPKELSDFNMIDKTAVKACKYRERCYNNPDYTNGALLLGGYACTKKAEMDWCRECKIKPLTRPPQSWCYVEGATNNE